MHVPLSKKVPWILAFVRIRTCDYCEIGLLNQRHNHWATEALVTSTSHSLVNVTFNIVSWIQKKTPLVRLELTTPGLRDQCSNH